MLVAPWPDLELKSPCLGLLNRVNSSVMFECLINWRDGFGAIDWKFCFIRRSCYHPARVELFHSHQEEPLEESSDATTKQERIDTEVRDVNGQKAHQ